MFKNIKLLVMVNWLLVCTITQPVINKDLIKLIVSGGAAVLGYKIGDAKAYGMFQDANCLPDLNIEKSNKIKNMLISKAPADIDREFIKKIKIKFFAIPSSQSYVSDPVACIYKDQAIITVGDREWSDFMYLRVLSKLHHNPVQRWKQTSTNCMALATGLAVHFFLKKPGFMRGIGIVFWPILGFSLSPASYHFSFRDSVRKANHEAIESLLRFEQSDLELERAYLDIKNRKYKSGLYPNNQKEILDNYLESKSFYDRQLLPLDHLAHINSESWCKSETLEEIKKALDNARSPQGIFVSSDDKI